ncbi:hypothetical protein EJB05_05573, partial [Eragrostis curvula]
MATVYLQLLAVATYATAATTRKSLMTPAQSSSAEISFLHMSCGATKYPDTCYSVLLPNVTSFHGSLARVARTAATIAVAKQHRFVEDLAHLKLRSTGAGRVADMTLVNDQLLRHGVMQCIDWLHAAGEEALSNQTVKEVIAGCNDVSPYMDMALNLVNAIKF